MEGDATGPSARPRKRSFSIRGHRTSISLEAAFWEALKEAAGRENLSLAGLVARIDAERGATNLSSAVRVWVLAYFRAAAQLREPS
jgi:predicted DNA-binding ribbon-helix-helix protein